MKNKGLIYKLNIGRYFIIGSTSSFEQRKRQYKCDLKAGRYKNPLLQNVYNKYNKDLPLNFEILQYGIPECILIDVENIWIGATCARIEDKKYGMNCQEANGKRKSFKTRQKMKTAQTGKKKSYETKMKISNSMKGINNNKTGINKK